MTRLFVTTMMTLTFIFGGLAVSSSSAQACDSCAAHEKAKPKVCAKCKKAGKTTCDCHKKKSDVQADQLKCGKDCTCPKCKEAGKKSCDCDKKDCAKCKKNKKGCGCK